MDIIKVNDYYIWHDESCSYDAFTLVKINFNALLEGIKEIKIRCKEKGIKVKSQYTMAQIKAMENLSKELNAMFENDTEEIKKYNLNFFEQYGRIKAEFKDFSKFRQFENCRYGVRIGDKTILKYGKIIHLCERITELLQMDFDGYALIGF